MLRLPQPLASAGEVFRPARRNQPQFYRQAEGGSATIALASPLRMSYPGNATLTADTQQRLLRTFEQTLDLAARGSAQEALLGCDFILRMDPQFEPARTLLNRLNASIGAITVDDLRGTPPAATAAAPAPVPAPAPAPVSASTMAVTPREELSFADLDDFGAGDLSARLSEQIGRAHV